MQVTCTDPVISTGFLLRLSRIETAQPVENRNIITRIGFDGDFATLTMWSGSTVRLLANVDDAELFRELSVAVPVIALVQPDPSKYPLTMVNSNDYIVNWCELHYELGLLTTTLLHGVGECVSILTVELIGSHAETIFVSKKRTFVMEKSLDEHPIGVIEDFFDSYYEH